MYGMGVITVSKEEVRTARNNGLSRKVLYNRIVNLGWDLEKAINTPLQSRASEYFTSEDVAIAAKNGIGYKTFTSRVLIHRWTPERARTEPPRKSGRGSNKG